jgi:hypothetical protein
MGLTVISSKYPDVFHIITAKSRAQSA